MIQIHLSDPQQKTHILPTTTSPTMNVAYDFIEPMKREDERFKVLQYIFEDIFVETIYGKIYKVLNQNVFSIILMCLICYQKT